MEASVGIFRRGLDAGSFPVAIRQEGSTNHAMEARVGMCCRSFSAERVTPTPTGEWGKRTDSSAVPDQDCLRRGNRRRLIQGALVPLPATKTQATRCKSVYVSIHSWLYDHQL